ncbi:MAG: CHRD domain-containing protein, partial [Planctomycetota bacterium]|nr:CHRD domain-containing protein [Planctomycetota bacterium]
MKLGLAALVALGITAAPAAAIEMTFPLTFTGAEEVPGPGDSDGTATGTITFDRDAGTISWNITYNNITTPSAMHIHPGAAGSSGGVFVGLGVATTGGSGTLISSVNTSQANIDTILANPTGYYVNIHNADFGPGAIRAQIPALFQLCFCGANEVPGPGDPDGSGMG